MDKSKSDRRKTQKSSFQDNPGTWLKIIIILHIFLSSGSISGSACAYSSLLYNLLFLQMLCWALSGKSISQSLEVAIFISGISFIFEIIGIWICFPNQKTISQIFAFVLFILLILARPVEIYILWVIAMGTKDKKLMDHIGKQSTHNRPKCRTNLTVETACVNEAMKYQPQKEYSLVSQSHSDPAFYQENKEVGFQQKDEAMRNQRTHDRTCKLVVDLSPRNKDDIPKPPKRTVDITTEGRHHNNPVIYPGYIVPSRAKNFHPEPSQCSDMEGIRTEHRRSKVSYKDGGEPIKSDFSRHPSDEDTSAVGKIDRDNIKERNIIFPPIDNKKKNRPRTKSDDVSVSRKLDQYEEREYRPDRSTSRGSGSGKALSVGDAQDFITCRDLASLKLVFGDPRSENNEYDEDPGTKYSKREKTQDKSIIIKQKKILDRSPSVAFIDKDKTRKNKEVYRSGLVPSAYSKWQSFMKTKHDKDLPGVSSSSPLKQQASLFDAYDDKRLIPTVIHTYGQNKKNRALKLFGPNKNKNGSRWTAGSPKIMTVQMDRTGFPHRSSIMANKKVRHSDKPYPVINHENVFKYRS